MTTDTDLGRRRLLHACTGLAIAAALPPAVLADAAPAASAKTALLTRPIPASGEQLPMVGLGTNAYGVADPAEIAKRQAVVARLVELGGRVVDTARAYGESETVLGRIVGDLDVRDRIFLASKTPMQGDLTEAARLADESFTRLGVQRLDLLQVHNLHGLAEFMPTLRRLKEAGRVRYLGVTTSTDNQYPGLLDAIRSQALEFVQVDYSIGNRNAAAEVLPLAAERGLAVLVNMPYGGRRDGNLLRKLGERPLPPWAAELGAASWAQYLLKYVLGHPAVTCAIPGTTSVANLESNLGAANGPLPDAALRRRMEEHWDTLGI
jgi:aryl-alcohol dehydrogenase-like predicted oxidoreductase